jgi:hypothetical protein
VKAGAVAASWRAWFRRIAGTSIGTCFRYARYRREHRAARKQSASATADRANG